jgi:putative amide transporter protein
MSFTDRIAILTRLEGTILIYLGILFFLVAMSYLVNITKKEIISVSIFLSTIILLFSFFLIFGSMADQYSVEIGAITIFFSCLCLWHDFNIIYDIDNEGIGYYCLFFAILGIALIFFTAKHVTEFWGIWLTVSWFLWTILLIMYFLIHVKKYNIHTFFGVYLIIISIISAWLPGILLLTGVLQ